MTIEDDTVTVERPPIVLDEFLVSILQASSGAAHDASNRYIESLEWRDRQANAMRAEVQRLADTIPDAGTPRALLEIAEELVRATYRTYPDTPPERD